MGLPHLKMVYEQLRDYAAFLSELLNASVEFVDPSFTRIIGVGFYETSNDLISGGELYKYVFEKRQYIVISDAKNEPFCQTCKMQPRCMDKMEIVCPVITPDGVLAGALGVAAGNMNQRAHITEQQQGFLMVISKMCIFLGKQLALQFAHECTLSKVVELEAELKEKADAAEEIVAVRKLADIERAEIEKAISLYGKDTAGKQKAAKALGIGIATLYRKINEEK